MSSETPAPVTDIATLQTEIALARVEFLNSLSVLRNHLTPAALGERGLRRVGGFFTDEFGGVRPQRVAVVGAVVVGIVVIKLLRRRG